MRKYLTCKRFINRISARTEKAGPLHANDRNQRGTAKKTFYKRRRLPGRFFIFKLKKLHPGEPSRWPKGPL
jgi:hypothetical protein